MTKNKTKRLVLALCLLFLMTYTAATGTAWGKYPSFPNTFTLDGEEYLFPCELYAFIIDGWEAYDMATDDYMLPYETLAGLEEKDMYLQKDNQRIFITLLNQAGHELEIEECDVIEIRVSDYSFSPFDTPDIEFFGIRPGMNWKKLPKWFRTEANFTHDDVVYYVSHGFDNSILMMIEGTSSYHGSIYYSWNKDGKIEYFSIDVDDL
ncbi:MAG: hypothetical protein IKU73_03600 [Clostridia bacterium]|nr:hypothetical protein [Clostridia bacterium]